MGFISMEGHMSDSKNCTTHGGCVFILSFANSNCDSRLDSGHPKMSTPWSLEPVTVLLPKAKGTLQMGLPWEECPRLSRWVQRNHEGPHKREARKSERRGAEKGRRVCFVDGRSNCRLRKASGSWKGNGFSLRASKGNKALLTHWF